MKNNNESCFEVIFSLIMITLLVLIKGSVIVSYWKWFIEDFFNQPPIPFGIALGISGLISFMTYHPNYSPDDPNISMLGKVLVNMTTILIYWLGGFLYHWYFLT